MTENYSPTPVSAENLEMINKKGSEQENKLTVEYMKGPPALNHQFQNKDTDDSTPFTNNQAVSPKFEEKVPDDKKNQVSENSRSDIPEEDSPILPAIPQSSTVETDATQQETTIQHETENENLSEAETVIFQEEENNIVDERANVNKEVTRVQSEGLSLNNHVEDASTRFVKDNPTQENRSMVVEEETSAAEKEEDADEEDEEEEEEEKESVSEGREYSKKIETRGPSGRKRRRVTASRARYSIRDGRSKRSSTAEGQESGADPDGESAYDSRNGFEQPSDQDAEKTLKRKEAFEALSVLRNRIYGKRLLRLDEQEELIRNKKHERFNACVDLVVEHRNNRIHRATELLKKQLTAIQNMMNFVYSQRKYQFLFDKRKVRQTLSTNVAAKFYRLLNRQQISYDPIIQLQKQTSYRQNALFNKQRLDYETAVLCELDNFVGFPTAPIIEQASMDDIQQDLIEMGELFGNDR
ncbi:Sds3-like family protein Dep1 [Schizosaccharomyces cryophilus OY26]|uniref:Sds3-like family protein Dep1 n=1 Tax=Schizosaccharomyces cryophilus (strain OY26 / ATCC MYA-4695 / CBS 11777 / NBRC 106824 / NRRL Y48691) TaxID=653667 RepID=S9W540_SCHCR|nr:Sds3-like family protein Dep1 [Schizosaccharomyces cryophilus OY26]EPY53659.1 Sds3-like family protein Dep1 [Schizosaccharomyces cryophilus OY26]